MSINSKIQRFLTAGAILMGAAGLRFYALGKQSLFIDEAWSWSTTHLSFINLLRLPGEPHPPLYYILLKLSLYILPHTEAGLRVLSALASIASLAIVLLYVNSRWNAPATIFVGLLWVFSPFDVYYAQEARMYSLLGFLFICSYITLILALDGKRRFLLIWPAATILMAWTHNYGVIYAGVSCLFVTGYLIANRIWKTIKQPAVNNRFLILGVASIVLGVLPRIVLILTQSAQEVGGAWVPTSKDLLVLISLWTAGLAPTRDYFLDSAHLVLPALSGVPMLTWAIIGMALLGLPAVWGLQQAWKRKNIYRLEMILSLMLVILPVALVFLAGTMMKQQIWALKPFLGCSYLIYLWAGIGIGSLKSSLLRSGLAAAVIALALLSLWPYFTTWQKSDAAEAFHALPSQTGQEGVIIEPEYITPLVSYYLNHELQAYTIFAENNHRKFIYRVLPSDTEISGRRQMISCKELANVSKFWIYKIDNTDRKILDSWPACVLNKQLWTFQGSQWIQVNP